MTTMIKTEKCYAKTISNNGFRPGQVANVVKIGICKPENLEPRPCIKVKYSDGVIDYFALSELNVSFKLGTLQELLS